MEVTERGLGCRPDPYDPADVRYQAPTRFILPKEIDLRPKYGAIRDQGKTNSCTGFALAAVHEPGEPGHLSPLFIYYQERLRENTLPRDVGAYIRSGLQVLENDGVCIEPLHPFAYENVNLPPTAAALTEAHSRKVKAYTRILTTRELKHSLAVQKAPCIIGCMLYASFYTTSNTGVVKLPDSGERQIGGHAMTVVGYRDILKSGLAIVRNSWGSDFGENGYCYLPYEYLENVKLTFDVWSVSA